MKFIGGMVIVTSTGQRSNQYWSPISKQYWSPREVVLVGRVTSTGRKAP